MGIRTGWGTVHPRNCWIARACWISSHWRNLGPIRPGGDGEVTRFVCGYMACDPQLCRPILAGLPRVLKVNARAGASGQWLEDSIGRLVQEVGSNQPGSEAMLAKLSEALFVETLRQYVASLPAEETGWLA